ncbi:MAG: arylsulfotransferase family protein [Solirubrobacteraceae bacterium]
MRVSTGVSRPGTAAGLIFLDPFRGGPEPFVGQPGPLILDGKGDPVWFHPVPADEQAAGFRVQSYHGSRVLTWWQGTIAIPPRYTNIPPGSPEPGARFYIYDSRYRRIATIVGQGGFTADLHEIVLTPRGSALIAVAKEVPADLSPYGGAKQGHLEDSAVQEIDVRTGRLLYQWDMLAHVPLSEAQVKPPARGVWDPYHLNSIQQDARGNLLISARDTWAIYEISRPSGRILWQLGGKGETIRPTADARFFWQHDARLQAGGKLSLFDDGCCDLPAGRPEHHARGLVLKLDLRHHVARLATQYEHQPPLFVPTQGNLQYLPGGHVFVGWGQQPFYSEYTAGGKLLLDVRMPGGNESYRTFRLPWVGVPYYAPRIAVHGKGRRWTVFASWNGATQVVAWEVLGGTSPGHLTVLARALRKGFETAVSVRSGDRYFQVRALGSRGRLLRASRTLSLTPGASQGLLSPTY